MKKYQILIQTKAAKIQMKMANGTQWERSLKKDFSTMMMNEFSNEMKLYVFKSKYNKTQQKVLILIIPTIFQFSYVDD